MTSELVDVWSKAKPKKSKFNITMSRIADIVYYLGIILFVIILAIQGWWFSKVISFFFKSFIDTYIHIVHLFWIHLQVAIDWSSFKQ